jgi:hypothetical protein
MMTRRVAAEPTWKRCKQPPTVVQARCPGKFCLLQRYYPRTAKGPPPGRHFSEDYDSAAEAARHVDAFRRHVEYDMVKRGPVSQPHSAPVVTSAAAAAAADAAPSSESPGPPRKKRVTRQATTHAEVDGGGGGDASGSGGGGVASGSGGGGGGGAIGGSGTGFQPRRLSNFFHGDPSTAEPTNVEGHTEPADDAPTAAQRTRVRLRCGADKGKGPAIDDAIDDGTWYRGAKEVQGQEFRRYSALSATSQEDARVAATYDVEMTRVAEEEAELPYSPVKTRRGRVNDAATSPDQAPHAASTPNRFELLAELDDDGRPIQPSGAGTGTAAGGDGQAGDGRGGDGQAAGDGQARRASGGRAWQLMLATSFTTKCTLRCSPRHSPRHVIIYTPVLATSSCTF